MNIRQPLETVWEFAQPAERAVANLVRKLGISDPLARVLVNRGITDADRAKTFLKPSLKDLEAPEKLPYLDEAVSRLNDALKRDELIAVYGDYDVDGITATSLLANFLQGLNANFITYTPDRMTEGYGLNPKAMSSLAERGVKLVVALDLGVGDVEAVKKASELGVDVVIVDHHQAPDELPEAVAVVDPYRAPEGQFFKGMSAAGLAFYLIAAFRAKLRDSGAFNGKKEPNLRSDLDLVALGTIADLAPLIGPNRVIAYYGLLELGAERRPGIAALKKVASMGRKDVTAGQVAFQLAPRINAAGRIGKAERAVRLMTTSTSEEAMKIAIELDELNRKRQEVEQRILQEAFDIIEGLGLNKGSSIVISGKKWHPGVIGIVASKITDAFGLPSIVVALDDEVGKGSARSVQGLHIYQAIKECSQSLIAYGGHEMAAGIVIRKDKVDEFRDRFEEVVSRNKPPLRQTILKVDAELDLEDLDGVLAESLSALHPHGVGNPEPLYYSSNVYALDPRMVGNSHLKFRIKAAEGPIEAIAFSKADLLGLVREKPVDLVYTPRLTTWEGWKRLEIKVRDIRPSRR